MEHMIHNRLYYQVETRAWPCPVQVGFRTSRSSEDQILRIEQTISDGYQATKPNGTVLTLLDFSKAFDCVWKEDLLLRAVDKGLSLTFAKWLRDFLSNRQPSLQINIRTRPADTAETGAAAGVSTIAAAFLTLYQRSEDRCTKRRRSRNVCR